jgi:DNA-binding MarR family transcriptional regulator
MEENGLVTKKRDEKLKSVVRITITAKGKKISTQYNGADFIAEMMSVLSEEERAQMMASMRKLLVKATEELGVVTIWPPMS